MFLVFYQQYLVIVDNRALITRITFQQNNPPAGRFGTTLNEQNAGTSALFEFPRAGL